MEWLSLNTLREKYLSFFESKGHLRLGSFSLVPQNDNSLLLINSGMAPMKKYFTGEITPPKTRITTCQKCIRTPDIERVGKTARHGTYFEMLGNFSFGDYFKHEATAWAWEFCTKVMEMPVEKLWVTIYMNDDEAFEIWTKEVGVSADHIVRLGKEDNFWEHGSGPCGPCSEIYFDRGEKYGCGSPTCGVGCDCDRYTEFWNLVFTQFESDGNNNYTPLSHPNIDTGMGLERLACISQGVDNLFEVDTVRNIMLHLSKIAGVEYKADSEKDVSMRVITDHIRSTSFMIADGVFPSNEGRGYVLRRLLRRAARHGRLLGISRPFLSELCDTVIEENKSAYPELLEKRDLIKKLISVEEDNFGKTIDQGLKMLDELTASNTSEVISGDDAFKLNDTYGFPLDLTKDIVEEKGFTVDEQRFNDLMLEQRTRARNSRKSADAEAWKGEANLLNDIFSTSFCGYKQNDCDAKVIAIISDSKRVDFAAEGDSALIILNTTPFYAESGGQIGDIGTLKSNDCEIDVENTLKNQNGLFTHVCAVKNGAIKVGDTVKAEINVERRMAIRRNHTAAHLLQAALRKVLGTHVEQAGQLVSDNLVRFDFTHFSALTSDELSKIESYVNDAIFASINVLNEEMPIAEAKSMGAMALFGEKYGNMVRVVATGEKSIELCGGTHVDNTSKIGMFKIISESSIASGVRRIEAVTGFGVLELINDSLSEICGAAAALKLNNTADLVRRCEQVSAELKEKEKEIERLNSKLAVMQVSDLLKDAKTVGNVKLLTATFKAVGSEAVRSMAEVIRDKAPDTVAVFVDISDESATIAVTAGSVAQINGVQSGKLVSAIAAIAGGKGGGRPDFAMAGVKDVSKINDALSSAGDLIIAMLK
ncbi:MAG: alanine--tRNA ligase [Oscillospiraceae bacterium]|nr:alanine--tRNA ligase [Oscillospiraceae bacterium]